ncbi:MAG: response regulator [Lachnospiraceae bacterium]|nr:response regulator [Lachnospiraceae bacterium]
MMDDVLTIMLVEDDEDTCAQIAEYANTFDDIRIIKTTNNSVDAYSYTLENMPDAVILDLELHEGGGNGLDFLTKLANTFGKHKPFILLTTHNVSNLIKEEARALGTDFILTKYSEGYTHKEPISLLRILRHTIVKNRNTHISPGIQSEELLRQQIEIELAPFNFHRKSKGYTYLCDIILNTCINNLDYSLDNLADKYGQTVPSVERAMQRAIKRAWNSTSIEVLFMYYDGSIDRAKGHPTLKKFVLYYAKKLLDYGGQNE